MSAIVDDYLGDELDVLVAGRMGRGKDGNLN